MYQIKIIAAPLHGQEGVVTQPLVVLLPKGNNGSYKSFSYMDPCPHYKTKQLLSICFFSSFINSSLIPPYDPSYFSCNAWSMSQSPFLFIALSYFLPTIIQYNGVQHQCFWSRRTNDANEHES